VSAAARPPSERGRLLFGAKARLARLAGSLSRRSGRGGGTTLPGRMMLRLAPDAIGRLGRRLPEGSTLISATNGKTTTAGMIAAALHADGRRPVHNRAGSNMAWGVATALLEQRGEEGLFEVDEAWLPQVSAELDPRLVVLANLFRDQLDRYGELERLADEWAELVAAREDRTAFVLNADDPLIADLGRDPTLRRRRTVSFFGIEDPGVAVDELQHAFDAKRCRRCGTPYAYERAFVGHLGHFSCPNCEADRPEPDVAATEISLHGIDGSEFTVRSPQGELRVRLPLPGLYNVYNALAAIAASLQLGVGPRRIEEALGAIEAVFGRVETIEVAGRALSIFLVKNPAGANEVLRTIRLEAARSEGERLDLWLALNDRIADGRDVSWIWDADFELLAGDAGTITCSGTRAAEMALRLKYAGWPTERIRVVEGIGASLDAALAESGPRLFALPTYTALLELRTLLARRGAAGEYWR
jgi:lipid II isoglutaminyl synthase (glutamine-hydrolysing)